MTQTAKTKDHFLRDLSQLPANGHPRWWRRLRDAGKARFEEAPYPHTRMEEWRQTSIAPIVDTAYRSLVEATAHGLTPEDVDPYCYGGDWTELVFVDGFFCDGLSRKGALPAQVTAGGLHDALAGGEATIVKKHLGGCLGDRSVYTALNSAFLQDGGYVHVPKNVAAKTPIHLIFVTSRRGSDTASHIRNLIVLDANSQAAVVTSYVSLAEDIRYLNNVVTEVVLGPNAQLDAVKVVREGAAGNHLATTEIRQERDSRLGDFAATLGGAIVRNQICGRLAGEGATCRFNGLLLNGGERLCGNHLDIAHAAPHCGSRITYKGILDGASKAVFTGKVHVHPAAQQTDSDQINNNLLLSDRATVDTMPQLEIYADDVKCTHGATVGAPPEEVVFYFRSRGISESTARSMLTCGFAEEVIDTLAVAPIRGRLMAHVEDLFLAESATAGMK